MSEVAVFLAAFLGSFTGMLTAVLPIMYVVKKKLENSPMGAMFG
jgi:hypothetical protein